MVNVGAAKRHARHVESGIGLRSMRRFVIASAPTIEIGMNRIGAFAHLRDRRALAPGIDRADSGRGLPPRPLGRVGQGDAIVLGVDHAANSKRAITQGERPAQNRDPLRRQRINRDAMVFAHRRHVHRADSVLLKAHALVVEAAQDRAIGARPKRRARDARLLAQRRAKRRAASLRQLRLVEPVDAGARSKIFLKPRREKRRRSTHHDFGQLLLRMGLAASERRGRQRAGDNHETLNRHWLALGVYVIVLHMLDTVDCTGKQE